MKSKEDLKIALRILKQKQGLGKGEVAKRINITGNYLSMILKGTKPLTEAIIDSFHEQFGNEAGVNDGLITVNADVHVALAGLEAEVAAQRKLILGLITFINKNATLKEILDYNNPELINDFDEYVIDTLKHRRQIQKQKQP